MFESTAQAALGARVATVARVGDAVLLHGDYGAALPKASCGAGSRTRRLRRARRPCTRSTRTAETARCCRASPCPTWTSGASTRSSCARPVTCDRLSRAACAWWGGSSASTLSQTFGLARGQSRNFAKRVTSFRPRIRSYSTYFLVVLPSFKFRRVRTVRFSRVSRFSHLFVRTLF